jgi:hypothetical protein
LGQQGLGFAFFNRFSTFSDAIACVRRKMWYHFKFQTSLIYDKVNNLFIDFSDHLISLMAKAA